METATCVAARPMKGAATVKPKCDQGNRTITSCSSAPHTRAVGCRNSDGAGTAYTGNYGFTDRAGKSQSNSGPSLRRGTGDTAVRILRPQSRGGLRVLHRPKARHEDVVLDVDVTQDVALQMFELRHQRAIRCCRPTGAIENSRRLRACAEGAFLRLGALRASL